jgi:hypothetical protein
VRSALSDEQPDAAIRLFSANARIRAEAAIPIWPNDTAEYEDVLAHARALLGAEAFAAAWEAGQALDVYPERTLRKSELEARPVDMQLAYLRERHEGSHALSVARSTCFALRP